MKKMIHYSLVVLAAVAAPLASMASDALFEQSVISAARFNDQLVAEAAAANSTNPGVHTPKVNVDQNGVILKGHDPVAYFKEHRAVKGDPKYSSSYGGATYYFESASNKATFDSSPAKYVPQYGGYCANGMIKGQFNDCDPSVFFIYKGKLYVCENPKKGKAFKLKPDANIRKADANWRTYVPPSNPGFRRELGS